MPIPVLSAPPSVLWMNKIYSCLYGACGDDDYPANCPHYDLRWPLFAGAKKLATIELHSVTSVKLEIVVYGKLEHYSCRQDMRFFVAF